MQLKTLVVVLALFAVLSLASVVKLNKENFDAIVLDNTKNVFVKFFAPWCGHCVRMAPVWEELAKAHAGSQDVVIAELDADQHGEVSGKYGVRGFPTIKLFTKGDKTGKPYQGSRDIAGFEAFLKANQ